MDCMSVYGGGCLAHRVIHPGFAERDPRNRALPTFTAVPQTRLDPIEMRAFGDFFLSVVRTSVGHIIQFLMSHVPEARYADLSTAQREDIARMLHAEWSKIVSENPREALGALRYSDELNDALHRMHSASWSYSADRGNLNLLDGFLDMVGVLYFLFGLRGDEQKIIVATRSIIQNHSDKISKLEKLLENGRLGAAPPYTENSPWASSPGAHGSDEWYDVHIIFMLIRDLPLAEVIGPALLGTRNLHSSRWDGGRVDREAMRRFFDALFLHPIAMQFWSTLMEMHGCEAVRAAVQTDHDAYRTDITPLKNELFDRAQGLFLTIYNPHDPLRARTGDYNPTHVCEWTWAQIPAYYRPFFDPVLGAREDVRSSAPH
jgi:hypothetical protein